MPYVRSKKSYKRKRGRPSAKRTYKKIRKSSTTYRRISARKRYAKRLPKYAMRAYKGAFKSLGNRYIRDKKLGVTRWMMPFTTTIQATDVQTTGKIMFGVRYVDCTSGVFAAEYNEALQQPDAYWAENWNNFGAKYQRAQVRTCHVTAEFFIQDESDIQYLNSDYFLVGLFVSREQILPSMTGTSGDWQRWKRFGNFVTKKYVKNVSGWLRVQADINVPTCMAANDIADTRHTVWPTDKFSEEKIGVVPARIQASYPTSRLYCTPFIVPLTRAQSTGANSINVQYRLSVRKRVLFDRPIVNPQGFLQNNNYPPLRSDLPAGYAPLTDVNPNARLDALEARMDQDDIDDAALAAEDSKLASDFSTLSSRMDLDDFEDSSVQSATNFNTAQTNNLTTQVNTVIDDLGTISAQTDQNTIQIVSLSAEVDANQQQFIFHQAAPSNQAHG